MAGVGRILPAALVCAAGVALIVTAARRDPGPIGRTGVPSSVIPVAVPADAGWGELTGRVSDLDGLPVEGALVLAQDLAGMAGCARTGPDGAWLLTLERWDRVRPRWPDRGFAGGALPMREAEVCVAARAEGFVRSTTRRVVARRSQRTSVGPVVLYRGGFVSGRVIDEGGREVAARVRIVAVDSRDRLEGMQGLPRAWPDDAVRSEPGGGFRIGPLGPGDAVVFAAAPGVGAGSATVAVEEGRTASVSISVRAMPSIAGRVLDDTGRGVAGIRITCRPEARLEEGRSPHVRTGKRSSPEGLAPGVLATESGEGGDFDFHGVRADVPYAVVVTGAESAALRGVTAGCTDLVLALPVRGTLAGTVTCAGTGDPLEGAALRLLPGGSAGLVRLTHPLGLEGVGAGLPASGPDGTFAIPDLFPGEYRLVVTRPGYEVAETPVVVVPAGGSPEPVEVRVVRAGSLAVVVGDGRGGRVAGAEVSVAVAPPRGPRPLSRAGPWSGRLNAVADGAGVCGFPGLPAGVRLILRARDAEGRSARLEFVLLAGEERAETVTLAEPAVLSFHVDPVTSGARGGHPIRLAGLDDPEIDVLVETDAEGRARVTRLPPGRYRIMATDPLEDESRPEVAGRIAEVDLSAGVEAESRFRIPDVTRVHGRVLVGDAPLADGRVGFGPLQGTPDHFRPLLFRVRKGAYEGVVPPGLYHVSVEYPGRRIEIEEPVRIPAAPEHPLDWSLPGK
ncbi:MAG: carboxypeptidase regulatory-like domain-containing protein [Planctomycetes bacterium]|jgi:hypothetical protein|nr:carboxypeptidase regulatory-like domain-containing protein [Planctomycetota bacterium]